MGWNIFPVWVAIVMMLATAGAVIAALSKSRNVWATALMSLAILGMAGLLPCYGQYLSVRHSAPWERHDYGIPFSSW